MNQEVERIFQTVEEFSSSKHFGPFVAESSHERGLLFIVLFSLAATTVLLFVEPLQLWAIVSGLIFLLSMITLALAQARSALLTFRTPLKGYASVAGSRLKRRIEYIEQLSTFSPESLQLASKALEADASRMKKRLYSLVGAIDKAGFIPAGLALYFASTKIVAGDSDLSVNVLTAFIFGLYGGALLGHRMAELLSVNVTCIQEAQTISARRREMGVE